MGASPAVTGFGVGVKGKLDSLAGWGHWCWGSTATGGGSSTFPVAGG